MRWAVVVVAASACGSPRQQSVDASPPVADVDAAITDAPPVRVIYSIPGAQSGTRLKQRWLETADGTRHPVPFELPYDSVLDFQCFLQPAPNGNRLCIPYSSRISVVYFYADCTSPMAMKHIEPLPRFVYEAPAKPFELYEVGPTIARPAYYYTQSADGTCRVHTSQVVETFYSVSAVTSQLAELTTEYRMGGTGALQQAWRVSADGFEMPIIAHGFDTTFNVPCAIGGLPLPGFEQLCRPVGAVATAFTSSGCTGPLGEWQSVGDPTLATYPESSGDDHIYGIAAEITPTSVYKQENCLMQRPRNPDSRYYPVLGQIGTMANAQMYLDPPNGHRLRAWKHGGGLDMRTGYFHDTVLDIDCTFVNDSPCVPFRSNATRLFTDTACTAAIDVYAHTDPASVLPPFAGVPNLPDYRRLTTEHGATLYKNTSTGCESWKYHFPTATKFWDLGPPTPLSDFEQATYFLDP
jgi:hypothetical protein